MQKCDRSDPQLVRLDVVGLEPRVAGQPRRGLVPLIRREPVAAGEDRGILVVGPALDLLEHRRQAGLLQVGRQPVVVPGDRRVRGQVVQERQVVARAEDEPLEVEAQETRITSVEGDAVVDQVAGQPGGAGRAVALADQVERRRPAVVPGQVHPDELADATRCRRCSEWNLAFSSGLAARE